MPAFASPPLIASSCAGCGRSAGVPGAWCTHCRDRWSTVPGWWEPEPGGTAGWAAAHYDGPVRRAVLVAKRGASAGLTQLLLERLPPGCLPRDAMVTWIPAHPRRAVLAPDAGEMLARALARREGLRSRRLLARSPLGRRQAGKDRDERRADAERLGLRTARQVPAAVVIVDDVRTTGATLDHAADLLRAAGARHVVGIAVAQAGPR